MKSDRRARIEAAFRATTWGNTTERPEDWERLLSSGDEREVLRIFTHLFQEDPSGEHTRALFSREDIVRCLKHLDRPYRLPHLERKRRIWRTVYLDEVHRVPGLDWFRP